MKRLLILLALLIPGFSFAQNHETNLSQLGIPPGAIGIYCVDWSTTTGPPSYTTNCPGSGGGSSNFNVNGSALLSSTTVNFQNSTVTGGLTLTFTNPSNGNVQLGLSGWPSTLLANDCLTNNGTTISWGGCGGSSFQVNGSNLFSQTTVNFLNSAATNGQTFTFTNPTAGSVQLGVSGTLTTGGGGTGIGATPANGQLLIGNGSGYTLATVTAGSNITITNSAGGITIAAPGGAGVSSATGSGLVACSPTTGAVTCSGASQPANTILMNNTGATAQPTAVATSAAVQADLAATTTFTVAGTGCTPSAHAGGPFGGTVTLAAGPCTALVVTPNGATGFTAPNGYTCTAEDRTLLAAGTWLYKWGESATTTTTVTIPIPSAAGATDVISFACQYY